MHTDKQKLCTTQNENKNVSRQIYAKSNLNDNFPILCFTWKTIKHKKKYKRRSRAHREKKQEKESFLVDIWQLEHKFDK